MRKHKPYDHEAKINFKSMDISPKIMNRKINNLNGWFTKEKPDRHSILVEKMENTFTKRELAFLVTQNTFLLLDLVDEVENIVEKSNRRHNRDIEKSYM